MMRRGVFGTGVGRGWVLAGVGGGVLDGEMR